MTHAPQLPDRILLLGPAEIRAICRNSSQPPAGLTVLADEWGECGRWTIERTIVFKVEGDERLWGFTWRCAVGDGDSEYPAAHEAFEVEAREVRTTVYARK